MKKVILIGNPVGHSLSPILHNYWLGKFDLDGRFEARKTQRHEIPGMLSDLRGGKLAGINVTIPHKETAFSLLDEFSEAAGKIGAANTLYITQGKLAGKNTDPEGFIENLKFSAPDWNPSGTALVLGTGAATKAVIYALQKAGLRPAPVMKPGKGALNINSALAMTCGGLPLTFEYPTGDEWSFDDLLEHSYVVLRCMLEHGQSEPYAPREAVAHGREG